MSAFSAFLLLCLSSTPGFSEDTVYVHEWGVVELGGEFGALSAYPGVHDVDAYFEPFPQAAVRAPVIWFHGAVCTGTLTVRIEMSGFTTLIPRPDSIAEPVVAGRMGFGPFIATWEGLEIGDPRMIRSLCSDRWSRETRSFPLADDIIIAFDSWRRVPSNLVHHSSSGYIDSFLYYETELYDASLFEEGDWYGYSGEALVFFEESGEMVCVRATIPTEEGGYGGERLTDQAVADIINTWSPEMAYEEIYALCATWMDHLETRCVDGGETLLLFPLSSEQVGSLSTVSFAPDQELPVRYARLFLGLGPV